MTRDSDSSRQLAAPQLRETADIWWDSGTDPLICWDQDGRRLWLSDGADPTRRLTLLDAEEAVEDPHALAEALRDGLAACDFPPTGDGVAPGRLAATLRAAGMTPPDTPQR